MSIDALAFHMSMIAVYEKYNDRRSGDCKVAHVKSTRIESDVNQESLAFCMQHCVCKKYKDGTGRRSGAPCFFYMALHM
jgi:hypothetical protein